MIGRLTHDVELVSLNTGVVLARLRLASNNNYKKSDGTMSEDVCYIDVTLFGKAAENANRFLRKGSKILVEGRLRYETYVDQQGNNRSKHSITAESVEYLDSKQQSEGYGNSYDNASGGGYGASRYGNSGHYGNHGGSSQGYSRNTHNKNAEPPEIDVNSDEIPF